LALLAGFGARYRISAANSIGGAPTVKNQHTDYRLIQLAISSFRNN
jgi:hypothetical protein